ncbi:hypothetical protein ACHAWF_015400 [Thalassiosira exigua]
MTLPLTELDFGASQLDGELPLPSDQPPLSSPPPSPAPPTDLIFLTPFPTPPATVNDVVETLPPAPPPSLSPTTKPTVEPTSSPTAEPSYSNAPSASPTGSPSTSTEPTTSPSLSPSITRDPSQIPSVSSAPTSKSLQKGMTLTLGGVRYVPDVKEWERATARFFQKRYNRAGGNDEEERSGLTDARVDVALSEQNTQREQGRAARRRLGWHFERTVRALQQREVSVAVTYAQITSYASRDEELSDREMLKYPLATEEDREAYVETLRTSLSGYESLTSASGIGTPYDSDLDGATGGTEDSGGGGLTTNQIIAIAFGSGAALFLLLAAVALMTRGRGQDDDEEEKGGIIDKDDNMGESLADGSDDRGKAGGGRGGPALLGDMSVASGDDYRERTGPEGAAEELRTVRAPVGKLGIVIDSPDAGAPMIHGVKETSPVADQLRAGDRLVAVDDEDVRAMTAVRVSKLIGGRSGSPRKLTVVRYVFPEQ